MCSPALSQQKSKHCQIYKGRSYKQPFSFLLLSWSPILRSICAPSYSRLTPPLLDCTHQTCSSHFFKTQFFKTEFKPINTSELHTQTPTSCSPPKELQPSRMNGLPHSCFQIHIKIQRLRNHYQMGGEKSTKRPKPKGKKISDSAFNNQRRCHLYNFWKPI